MRKVLWPILLVLVYGCDIFDKDESIPGFIYIQSSDLATNQNTEGANTSRIFDATVYADGEFMGTFELPATVPILKNGNTNITVGAGIKNNGLGSDRQIYDFYDFYTTSINLMPDVVTPINADSSITYEYYNGLTFEIEDFNAFSNNLIPMDLNTAAYNPTSAEGETLQGTPTLKVNLDQSSSVFYVKTNWELNYLQAGNSMYLEIDFKGDHYLEIGVLAQNPERTIFAAGINPTDDWTKVYVELTDEISPLFNSDPIQIYFYSELYSTDISKTIFIDNIKFITP